VHRTAPELVDPFAAWPCNRASTSVSRACGSISLSLAVSISRPSPLSWPAAARV
jgi:hypothetical protein